MLYHERDHERDQPSAIEAPDASNTYTTPKKSKLSVYAGIGGGLAVAAILAAFLVPKMIGQEGQEESKLVLKPDATATLSEEDRQAVLDGPAPAPKIAGFPTNIPADPAVTAAELAGIPTPAPPVATISIITPTAASAGDVLEMASPASTAPNSNNVVPATIKTPSTEKKPAMTSQAGSVLLSTATCDVSFDVPKGGVTKCGYTIKKAEDVGLKKIKAKSKTKPKLKPKSKVTSANNYKEATSTSGLTVYAAKGGRIWVSDMGEVGGKSNGTGVRSYITGDILPDGSKVLSITQPDGTSRKTVVKTTKGRISD